jgi:hypothetical protein
MTWLHKRFEEEVRKLYPLTNFTRLPDESYVEYETYKLFMVFAAGVLTSVSANLNQKVS